MNSKRIDHKTRSPYLFEHAILRFFLLAMRSGNGPDNAAASIIDEIGRKGLRILVIDDDDKFRKSFCFKLKRKFKAKVDDVNSGIAGIEKFREGNSYDFVFMDIMMPVMTGIETYHELRKIDANIRIVILSAYSNSEEWKRAQELEDVSLLNKPIPEDALIRVLSERCEE